MNESTDFGNDDRGVSELVGFVIVFGIIIGSVGILYMTGFSAMGAVQEQEQTRNAERAMDALAENLNDIVETEGVAYRSGEMSLRQGTLSSSENGTTITVDPDGKENLTGSGVLTYETDETEIVYEGGAVIRSTESGGWTIREPPIRCAENTAIISLVTLDVDETSVTASGTRSISATQTNTTVKTFDGVNVLVKLEPPESRADAWDRSFKEAGCLDDVEDDIELEQDKIIVRETTVELDYS